MPTLWRIIFLLQKLLLIIHWDALVYVLISNYEGLGSNEWVQPSPTITSETLIGCAACVNSQFKRTARVYLHSVYFATQSVLVGYFAFFLGILYFFFCARKGVDTITGVFLNCLVGCCRCCFFFLFVLFFSPSHSYFSFPKRQSAIFLQLSRIWKWAFLYSTTFSACA